LPYPWAWSFSRIILRARREDAGLSQQELADRIEGVRSYIQFLEYGKQTPTTTTLILVAEALKIDPAGMLRDSVQMMKMLEDMGGSSKTPNSRSAP
jgi:transcriptional regulator with XRE-family HTH domain